MARLKGGKLLLDLTQYRLSEEPIFNLTQEQVDIILTKGLQVKLQVLSTLSFVYDVNFVYIDTEVNQLLSEVIEHCNGEDSLKYKIALSFTDLELSILAQ